MLTVTPREACLVRIWNFSEDLPFLDDQFSCILGLLCDPFWSLQFLSECYRVLAPKGMLFLTLPDYEWGQTLRSSINLSVKLTRFKLFRGGEIQIPSNLTPPPQIEEMFYAVGFRNAPQVSRHVLPRSVTRESISPDVQRAAQLKNLSPYAMPILTLVRTTK